MDIIEIKVTLEDVEPPVTRTLQVPANIRLDRLHLILQAALGWTNSHLYMFEAGGANWGIADPDFGGDDLPASKTTLSELLEDTQVKSFSYLYDFGDSWEHQLQITGLSQAKPGELYPKLVEVAGRCPPEDIGGAPGYEMFLEATNDPSHPEHEEYSEWYDADFDPNNPETDILIFEVMRLAKKWKPRKPGK